MGGRPGVGKTSLARALARATGAMHLRIDSVEQALRAGRGDVADEGYRVACAVAEDNLRLGHSVVADEPWDGALAVDTAHRSPEDAAAWLLARLGA